MAAQPSLPSAVASPAAASWSDPRSAALPSSSTYAAPPVASYTAPNPRRGRGSVPKKVQTASLSLVVGGVAWLMVLGAMGFLSATGPGPDGFAKVMIAFAVCMAAGFFASAGMVWGRVPLAIVPATLVAGICAIFFPLGTIVGVMILVNLYDAEVRRYLA